MRDLRGNLIWDSPRMAGSGTEIRIPCKGCASGYMNLSSAIAATTVTGGRIKDGMRSILYHVIIVAEPAKLGEYEVGTLADYIAMLALSQAKEPDNCNEMASILDYLSTQCAEKPESLTLADKTYLEGLYHMDKRDIGSLQKSNIAEHMQDGMSGK
jgi:hypothetical protein